MWIEELKVLSEEEIGRTVTQVDSNGTYDNAPLPGTVGEIAPEYVNVETTFTATLGNSIVSYKLAAVSDIGSVVLESSTSSPTIKIVNSVDSSEQSCIALNSSGISEFCCGFTGDEVKIESTTGTLNVKTIAIFVQT